MPLYICRVSDGRGRIREFLRESAGEEPLLRELSSRGLHPLSVKEQPEGGVPRKGTRRYPRRVVAEFTDLLALMLGSGLSLKDSLEVAQSVFEKGAGNELTALLLSMIRKGSPFHAALESAGDGFPRLYKGLVRIGERIGSLEAVFTRLSEYLSEEKKLRDRFSAALIYPAIVLGVALLSMVLMSLFLLPRLRDLFSQVGGEMKTRMDTLMGTLTASLIGIGAAAILAAGFLVIMPMQRRKGGALSLRLDALVLKVPLAATYVLTRELSGFSFAMETLTGAGVSVEEALREAAEASGNGALRAAILDIRRKVLQGERLSVGFSQNPLFPARISRWVGIGEKAGHVEKVFAQLRAYYQQEVAKWTQRLMVLVEPALIVVLGLLIVLFVVFFVVPIFNMYGGLL